jgi:hypothetical protein
MAQYLTLPEFRLRTRVPPEFVDELEARSPGFIDANLTDHSAYIDALLSKRYGTRDHRTGLLFEAPYPIAVMRWLTAMTTLDVWLRRGIAATDQEAEVFRGQYDVALSELKQAANATDGLFELPLRADTNVSGIAKQYPQSYTENSPFVWKVVQVDRGRRQDMFGKGWRR